MPTPIASRHRPGNTRCGIFGLDNGQVFPATTGYDMSTGLGSPQLTSKSGKAGLAFYLCSMAGQASRPTVTGLSPALLPAAGGTVTITGTGFKPGGSAAVAGIQVGTWRVRRASSRSTATRRSR